MRLPLFQSRPEPEFVDEHRSPVTPYPVGWYGLLFSHELAVGEVKRARLGGREVVAFRTASGRVSVFEAHCPHLGAHFGYGGCVEGETLRCPMHDFRFSAEGSCVAVGHGHKRPPSAKAGVVPSMENCGVLLAWHHPDRAAPTWEPPPLVEGPEADGPPQRWSTVIRTPIQNLAENLFDNAHLVAVHGYEESEMGARPETDGPVIRGGARFFQTTEVPGLFKSRVRIVLTTMLHGLGVTLFDSASEPGGLSFRGAFAFNPVGPDTVEFRVSVWIRQVDAGLATMAGFRWLPERAQRELMGRLLTLGMKRDVNQDKAIVEHKRYLARPALSDGDGAISVFRRWTRQFYPSTPSAAAEPLVEVEAPRSS